MTEVDTKREPLIVKLRGREIKIPTNPLFWMEGFFEGFYGAISAAFLCCFIPSWAFISAVVLHYAIHTLDITPRLASLMGVLLIGTIKLLMALVVMTVFNLIYRALKKERLEKEAEASKDVTPGD